MLDPIQLPDEQPEPKPTWAEDIAARVALGEAVFQIVHSAIPESYTGFARDTIAARIASELAMDNTIIDLLLKAILDQIETLSTTEPAHRHETFNETFESGFRLGQNSMREQITRLIQSCMTT